MVLMQKAVTPGLSHAYLTVGYDRVSGFAVRAADVEFASTPALLYGAHGLAFEGTPFDPDAEWVDILQFESSPRLQFEPVREHLLPLWWLRHTRLTPGAELIRVFRDRSRVTLARYGDVATGWIPTTMPTNLHRRLPLSRCVGPVAKYRGSYVEADVIFGGQSVILALANRPLNDTGFMPTPGGRWRKVVPRHEVEEIFELVITARWGGLAVRVVDQWEDAAGVVAFKISSIGHDEQLARSLGMDHIEAGVYEATVAAADLTDLTTTQLVPEEWRQQVAAPQRTSWAARTAEMAG